MGKEGLLMVVRSNVPPLRSSLRKSAIQLILTTTAQIREEQMSSDCLSFSCLSLHLTTTGLLVGQFIPLKHCLCYCCRRLRLLGERAGRRGDRQSEDHLCVFDDEGERKSCQRKERGRASQCQEWPHHVHTRIGRHIMKEVVNRLLCPCLLTHECTDSNT